MKKISKIDQKKISGGYAPLPDDEGLSDILRCTTPNGTEEWKRRCKGREDATQICRTIYPKYGNDVTGDCFMPL
jgi:hypothetical protein